MKLTLMYVYGKTLLNINWYKRVQQTVSSTISRYVVKNYIVKLAKCEPGSQLEMSLFTFSAFLEFLYHPSSVGIVTLSISQIIVLSKIFIVSVLSQQQNEIEEIFSISLSIISFTLWTKKPMWTFHGHNKLWFQLQVQNWGENFWLTLQIHHVYLYMVSGQHSLFSWPFKAHAKKRTAVAFWVIKNSWQLKANIMGNV